MKILVVDDSKAMRMIVIRSLRQAGLNGSQIIEAQNGVEALQQIHAESPDVVLSDWNMPEMNGLELLNNVRERGYSVRFGFITSESSPEVRVKAQEAGAEFLVTKPFQAEAFSVILDLINA